MPSNKNRQDEGSNRKREKLQKFLNKRPNRNSLTDRNILKPKSGTADPYVQAMAQQVQRRQVRDKLNMQMVKRSSIKDIFQSGYMGGKSDDQRARETINGYRDAALIEHFRNRPTLGEVVKSGVIEDTMTWSPVPQHGVVPEKRNCHSSCIVNGKLYIFGGYGLQSDQYLSVRAFDLETRRWSQVMSAGIIPRNRYSASCVCVDKHIILFGGFSPEGYWLNDFHVLDTNFQDYHSNEIHHMWYQPEGMTMPPCPRAAHSCTVVGRKLYFFGGNDGRNLFDDLYVLDTETFQWSRPHLKGTPPAARSGHSACLVNNYIVIFGGGGVGGIPMNDVHYLNLKTMTWVMPSLTGTPPSPRAGHTACVLAPHNNILIFGGGYIDKVYHDVHLLNIERGSWSRPADIGAVPCPRTGHSMNEVSGRIYVFGGCDSQGMMYNDLYLLDATFLRVPFSPKHVGSPAIALLKHDHMHIDTDRLAQTLTPDEQIFFSSYLDSTGDTVSMLLSKVERKIQGRQSEMKMNQSAMIAYMKNYHLQYENEFDKLRNEVQDVRNLVATELHNLKAQLVGFLSSTTKSSPRGKKAFATAQFPKDPSTESVNLQRRLTQPSIPGATPTTIELRVSDADEKEADSTLTSPSYLHATVKNDVMMSQPSNESGLDVGLESEPVNPSDSHLVAPGPQYAPPPPNVGNSLGDSIPDAMIFDKEFEAVAVDDDEDSVSGTESESDSVTSPVDNQYKASNHLAMLMRRDMKEEDLQPTKKKRRRKRKKKKHRQDGIRSAPVSPLMKGNFNYV